MLGGVAERLKAPVLKIGNGKNILEFESLLLRNVIIILKLFDILK